MSSRRVYLETFGCQMNELDSELVAGQLHALGYRFTNSAEDAHVVLYNTCSVREHAEQKVWSRLGELAQRKASDPNLVVGVLGCLAERDGVDLVKRMPVVDVLVGPGELDKLPNLLDNALRTRESLSADPAPEDPNARKGLVSAREIALQGGSSRRSSTLAAAADSLELLDLSRSVSPLDDSNRPSKSAYVRITRGCNKFCTYCVVPFTRGAEIHRPPQHIIDECKMLADRGVIEITLLGQTVNHYRFEHAAAVTVGDITQPQKGRSFTGGHRRDPFAGAQTTTFADLLARIHDEVPEIQRLRFVTSYPRDFGDDVLEVIRDHPRICRYLHVPAQSGSDRILKLMNRGYCVSEYLEFVDRVRHFLHQPETARPVGISSDFIIGFPTETDEDFEATASLIRRARFKNSFIFKYSPRPGTVAFDKLADDVPEGVKRDRNTRLLALQNEVSDHVAREYVGQTLRVFVEGPSKKHQAQTRQSRHAHDGTVSLTVSAREAVASARTATMEPQTAASAIQYCARSDTDMIVFFDEPAGNSDLTHTFADVTIERVRALSLFGVRRDR
ncbi:MAG TPA: MiaB/RimO family radical SAM methylthiotransferase [Phycisphaerales bacterium]